MYFQPYYIRGVFKFYSLFLMHAFTFCLCPNEREREREREKKKERGREKWGITSLFLEVYHLQFPYFLPVPSSQLHRLTDPPGRRRRGQGKTFTFFNPLRMHPSTQANPKQRLWDKQQNFHHNIADYCCNFNLEIANFLKYFLTLIYLFKVI